MSLFSTGEIVCAYELKVAKHLNGLRGEVMGPPSEATGRIPVRFAQNQTLTTKLVLPDNLKKLPDKDDPRIGYVRNKVEEGATLDVVRIENGADKRCITCGCELRGRYYLKLENETYYCEEHYASKYVRSSILNRFCAICHKYISIRDWKMLPHGVFESVYPEGVLADGTKIARDSPDGGSDKCFWAHTKCFRCSCCRAELCAKTGYIIEVDRPNQTANFYCSSSGTASTGCAKDHQQCSAAKDRLQSLQNLSAEDMRALLKQRNVSTTENDTHALLVRKLVVTENQGTKGDKQKHIVALCNEMGEVRECKTVIGRSQPGYYFLDRACRHGTHRVMDDAPMQSMKRSLVNDYMFALSGYFNDEYLRSGNDTQVAPGIVVTPLDNATGVAVDFFIHPNRYTLFRSDTEERLVPKLLWTMAIAGSCDEDGSEDYTRMNLCGALIAHAILDVVESKHPQLPSESDLFQMFGPPRAPLRILLQQVTESPTKMYQFMDNSKHRPCDCMQYVATAASMDLLRHKPMRVKSTKDRCAFCDAGLAKPKCCSLCQQVVYCDPICQRSHWKVHKKECSGRNKKN